MRGRAVGEHRVDREHVVAHRAVAKRSAAAGIVARHAADRRARGGGDVDREPQPLRLQPPIELVEHDPGLDLARPGMRIQRQDLGEPFRAIDDQRRVHRLPALRGSPAARQHGNAARSRDAEGARRLLDRAGNDHAERHDLIRRGVGRVTAARESVELDFADAFLAQRALEPGNRTAHLAFPPLGSLCIDRRLDQSERGSGAAFPRVGCSRYPGWPRAVFTRRASSPIIPWAVAASSSAAAAPILMRAANSEQRG